MNKQSKIIAVMVAVLILVIGITAYLNRGNVEEKTALNNEAIFMIKSGEETVKSYNLEDIKALGEVTFVATKDTSNSDPVEHEYIGVPLVKVFEDAGVEITEDDTIMNTAADGYVVALEASKVLDAENVYLTYRVDGKPIGTREEGGSGPYMIIVSKDQFSQYWCKYALSSEVK